jgi:hypothetical protein
MILWLDMATGDIADRGQVQRAILREDTLAIDALLSAGSYEFALNRKDEQVQGAWAAKTPNGRETGTLERGSIRMDDDGSYLLSGDMFPGQYLLVSRLQPTETF